MRKYIAFFLCIATLSTFSTPGSVLAATAENLNKQISDVNAQIQALDREIKRYQEQISTTNAESRTLTNLIKELTLTRDKLLKETKQTETKITATGLVITKLRDTIESKEESITVLENALINMIRDLRERDDRNPLVDLLSERDLAGSSREYNNIIALNEDIRGYVLDIEKEKEDLLVSKKEREGEQKNLTALKKTLVEKKLAVDISKKEKDTLLKETKNKESEYKKLVTDMEKKRDAFENALEEYEAQLKFVLNPKSLPSKGSGALAWPLDSLYMTSPFASRWGRFHYGTDFRASVGTQVMAMASGEVLGTGDTDVACKGASFGKWVFIKYTNGLSSTYGHLSAIRATVGQKVEAGDVVAFSGNTGSSTGPHLHVAVYASDGVKVETVPSKSCNGKIFTQPIAALSAYLDPMLYIAK